MELNPNELLVEEDSSPKGSFTDSGIYPVPWLAHSIRKNLFDPAQQQERFSGHLLSSALAFYFSFFVFAKKHGFACAGAYPDPDIREVRMQQVPRQRFS